MQSESIIKVSFKQKIKKLIKSFPPLTWAVVLMILVFAFIEPRFFAIDNLTNIVRRGSSLWMISTVATMILISGCLDLSLGSVLTFSGVLLALMLEAGINPLIASLTALLSGTLIGFLNGLLVSILGIPAFIVTLGSMNVFAGLSIFLTETGAIFIGDPIMVNFGAGSIIGIPIPIWISVLIFILSYIILHHTSFGRNLIAIGENKTGAYLSGVNTTRTNLLIFVYASTVAALAGIILASRIQSADPTVGVGWEFEAVAASIMGGTTRGKGKGDITTTIIGVVLILVLRNGLNIIGLPVMWRSAVVGLFLLGGIIFDITIRRREKTS